MPKIHKSKSDERLEIFTPNCFYDEPYALNNVIFYNHLSGSARQLVSLTNIPFQNIVSYFNKKNIKINPEFMISEELFLDFCMEYGYHLATKKKFNLRNFISDFKLHCPAKYEIKRQPLITIMGHVNHGKTTLIDNIRKTHVADREDGNITQKFGVYEVNSGNQTISILDTPGHEAFVHLRSQGVKITDIVIIVVAANDGVQQQTVEAIELAQKSNCKIIVSLNKVDLPGINKKSVFNQLAQHNLIVEGVNKNTTMIEISAKTGKNIDALLAAISQAADELKLVASISHYPNGVIIETGFDKFMGASATIYLISGTLKTGDYLMFENELYTVKFIENHLRKHVQKAHAGHIVRLYNFKSEVVVGAKFIGITDIKLCKGLIKKRQELILKETENMKRIDFQKNSEWDSKFLVADVNKQEQQQQIFEVIIVAENYGIIKAIEKMLQRIKYENHVVKIIQTAVGQITKQNILRARLSNAIIYSFNCKANKNALDLIKQYHVKVKYFSVIYLLVEDIEEHMLSQVDPFSKYIEIGRMVIKQIFNITKVGMISGCQVTSGYINNTCYLKVLRNNTIIHEGQISELKQHKQKINIVNSPDECGINIAGFTSMKIADEIVAFTKKS